MHRSRVGYDAMANRQIREKQILQKREEHLTKIAKIMTRKPGEGNLDNHAVVIVQSQHTARRQGVQQHKNAIVERENKNLLRRISTILTAAPKNSVESYNQMKALRASSKGGGPKVQFEKEIQQKRLNQFFVSVSKTGAYYNPDHWEKDYQKQVHFLPAFISSLFLSFFSFLTFFSW